MSAHYRMNIKRKICIEQIDNYLKGYTCWKLQIVLLIVYFCISLCIFCGKNCCNNLNPSCYRFNLSMSFHIKHSCTNSMINYLNILYDCLIIFICSSSYFHCKLIFSFLFVKLQSCKCMMLDTNV